MYFFSSTKRMEEIQQLAVKQKELTHTIDRVWVSLCAALIFQMEAGFALLEASFKVKIFIE